MKSGNFKFHNKENPSEKWSYYYDENRKKFRLIIHTKDFYGIVAEDANPEWYSLEELEKKGLVLEKPE